MTQAQNTSFNFANGPFDPNAYQIFGGMSNLPVGISVVTIVEAIIKATSTGGGMLTLTLEVTEGDHKGLRTNWNLNLYNKNPTVSQNSHRQLATICAAIGITTAMQDCRQLINGMPMSVLAELQTDPEAAAKGWTEVKRVLLNGSDGAAVAGTPAAQAAPATQAQQAAQTNAAAWGAPAQQQQQQQAQAAPQQQQAAPAQAAPAAAGWTPGATGAAGTPAWGT